MTAKGGNFAAPADEALAITPSDADSIPATRAIYVGSAGNVKVTMAGPAANDVTFTGVLAGSFLPIMVTKVFATGTTAANMVALR